MKKIVIPVAVITFAVIGAFAGQKGKAVEGETAMSFKMAKNEEKSAVLNVYHYEGVNGEGDIIFALGEPNPGDCTSGSKPCRFESTQTLTSPMSSVDIQSNATVTDWRP